MSKVGEYLLAGTGIVIAVYLAKKAGEAIKEDMDAYFNGHVRRTTLRHMPEIRAAEGEDFRKCLE